MVTLLLILFSVIMSILVFEGSNTYKKILDDKNSEENARIAMSFINMKIKQNDIAGKITVENKNDFGNTIIISYGGEEEGLFSYIYFKNNALFECYSDGELNDELSTKIVDIKNGKIEKVNDYLIKIQLDENLRTLNRFCSIRTGFERNSKQ